MTFPRRLTPSDKERATIVQQRMTPGGALGVASRHVRPADARTAQAAGGSAAIGLVAAARYESTAATPWESSTRTFDIGDADGSFGYDGAVNFLFLDNGVFQVSTWVVITGMTAGDVGQLEIDLATPTETYINTPVVPRSSGIGTGYVSSLPFNLGDDDGHSVNASCFVPSGTVTASGFYLVRLA